MKLEEKILKIDADDDDSKLSAFVEFSEEDTRKKKDSQAQFFNDAGETLLKEIDNKKERHRKEKEELSEYIIKHSENKFDYDQLMSYDINDVRNIYEDIKEEKKSLFVKIIKYIIGI